MIFAALLVSANFALADTPVGTLSVGEKAYKLSHGVAYWTKGSYGESLEVLISRAVITTDEVRKAIIKSNEGNALESLLSRPSGISSPNVTIHFGKDGKVEGYGILANDRFFGGIDPNLNGNLSVKDGRAVGKATMTTGEGKNRMSFDVRFDVHVVDVKLLSWPPKGDKSQP